MKAMKLFALTEFNRKKKSYRLSKIFSYIDAKILIDIK